MALLVDRLQEQSSIRIECDGCSRQFGAGDRFYNCRQCRKFELCQACTLTAASFSHDLRPCMLDPRDLRRTNLHGPSTTEFQAFVKTAESVPSTRYPAHLKLFCSQGATHGLKGPVAQNLATPENYETPASPESAITRAVQNDYSLYEDLNHENKDIRLILLVRGPADAPISALVARFSFPWTQVPWTALSYCWGCLDETRTISLTQMKNRLHDGQTPQYRQQEFSCTASLDIALRGLRREDADHWFWIDAICINQGNADERAYQVSIMSEIFARAHSIAIWLALSAEERLAAALVRALSRTAKEVCDKHQLEKSSVGVSLVRKILQEATFTSDSVTLGRDDVVGRIAHFFQNPWFTRCWVLQEVWSAKSDVIVGCGLGITVPWEEVLFANLYLTVAFNDFKTRLTGLVSPWTELTSGNKSRNASPQRVPILRLIEPVCHYFSASDPRDTLFALLTMGCETHTLPPSIAPDYTKSTAQVYTDFTRWCIQQHQSLEVLGYVTSMKQNPAPAFVEDAVPSWSLSGYTRPNGFGTKYCEISAFRASGDEPLDCDLIQSAGDSRTLPLRGYRIDTVANVNSVQFSLRFDKDNDLYLMDNTNTWYTAAGGGMTWVWRSARGADGKEARFCTFKRDSTLCTCQKGLDRVLLTMTCGGFVRHGDCDHQAGVHRERWLKPSEMYEMFATHWTSRGGSEQGDPNFELFCEHMREILLPLAGKGDPDAFAHVLLNATGRALFVTGDGKMGLCPPGARKDDIVVALFGGRAPFILRQRSMHDSSSLTWEFIGECFILEHMHGASVDQLIKQAKPCEIFHLW